MLATYKLIQRLQTALETPNVFLSINGPNLCIVADRIKGSTIGVEEKIPTYTLEGSEGHEDVLFEAVAKSMGRKYLAEKNKNLKKCPWKDSKGNDIFEGCRVKHPNDLVIGTVIFRKEHDSPSGQWAIKYDDGLTSRLSLQIGERGLLEVVP